jgi:hypothetical protein
MSSSRFGLKRIWYIAPSASCSTLGENVGIAYFVPGYRIQERRNALVEKAEKHRKVDDECPTKRLAIMLLEDIQYLKL